jgi:hypothetical protein
MCKGATGARALVGGRGRSGGIGRPPSSAEVGARPPRLPARSAPRRTRGSDRGGARRGGSGRCGGRPRAAVRAPRGTVEGQGRRDPTLLHDRTPSRLVSPRRRRHGRARSGADRRSRRGRSRRRLGARLPDRSRRRPPHDGNAPGAALEEPGHACQTVLLEATRENGVEAVDLGLGACEPGSPKASIGPILVRHERLLAASSRKRQPALAALMRLRTAMRRGHAG